MGYDLIQYDMIWYHIIWYDMIRYDVILYYMILHDMMLYDMYAVMSCDVMWQALSRRTIAPNYRNYLHKSVLAFFLWCNFQNIKVSSQKENSMNLKTYFDNRPAASQELLKVPCWHSKRPNGFYIDVLGTSSQKSNMVCHSCGCHQGLCS